ncbi:12765_t:CDS:2, partial [Gigaspora rosea]
DELIAACKKLGRFLKKDYEQEIIIDSNGISKHNLLFRFIDNIKHNTDLSIHSEIEELKDYLLCYLSHQMRKAYLNTQFNTNLLKLYNKGAVLVIDYKMKILPKSARETKQEFFGKKG